MLRLESASLDEHDNNKPKSQIFNCMSGQTMSLFCYKRCHFVSTARYGFAHNWIIYFEMLSWFQA